MSRKAKISGPEKIATIEKYLRGEDSLNHLATVLGVHHSAIQQWHQTYQSLGPNGLHNTSKNTAYLSELKTKAVEDYLSGCGSLMEICKRYGIKSNRSISDCINLWQLCSSGKKFTKLIILYHKIQFIKALYPEQKTKKHRQSNLTCAISGVNSSVRQIIQTTINVVNIFHISY